MPKIIIYTTESCPYCVTAKQLLGKKNLDFSEIRIDKNDELADEMIRKSNRYTVPQIFIDDYHVGGCDDLIALERSGQLDKILKS